MTLRAEMQHLVWFYQMLVFCNLPAIEELDTPVVVTNTTAKLRVRQKRIALSFYENNTAIASTVADGTGA